MGILLFRAAGDAKHLSDLLVREPFDVAEHQRHPVLLRDRGDGAPDPNSGPTVDNIWITGQSNEATHYVQLEDFADGDGCVFVPADSVERLLETAHQIWQTERKQAERIKAGETLRQQLKFADYLDKRASDPTLSFREHLRKIGGEIEE